ncbi:Pre-mRNA-splicing factor ATP-dependent RNA helicase prp22 [Talaromyces atroroseus]|uniref:RNA helicase n=1 Tax=Talaromyces atroroseus TaxID=1441469 RepID=A0A225B3A9_TALAT|nr:Pre-mRNA-splicing factor ATP-dependent RNA helicase prp22 [Talaromyces atroroseus]OKL61305.1 Pre-mRNA-splicing factor ATP-dependent RNA helicase prp22 [Talaromyces atroroseus]
MDDLESLELLSLVSRVTTELQNHLGINDKTLAEFVIDQHLKSGSFANFKDGLDALGADFPPSLIESIDRAILTMHPSYKNKKPAGSENNGVDDDMEALNAIERKSRVFKGLAIPDKVQTLEDDALDDTFAMLEGLAGKSREDRHEVSQSTKTSRKRSRSPDYGDYDSTSYRRERRRSISRSRSPERHRKTSDRKEYRNGHERRSRRDREDDHFRRPPTPELDNQPVLYKIYDGRVTGIKDFGAFVNLQGVRGKVDGLVHVSAMQAGARVNHPSDLVSRGQPVKVKIISIQGSRIGLSMKEVDQETGRDLIPQKRLASGANMEILAGTVSNDRYGNLSSDVPVVEGDMNGNSTRNRKRLTSPERWEIKQLIASGAASAADYPDIDQEYHDTLTGQGEFEEEVDIDIEVRDEEPPFLAGQTKQSLELSPIRVVRAAEGSLNRAAMSGSNLAKERRELRQQEAQEKAAEQAAGFDLHAQWEDPMANPEQRKFASDLRSAQGGQPDTAVPEWKRATQSKDISYGKRTNLTMKQQREGLPVFKFRTQLLDAVRDNQLMIVVGDTGSGKTTQLTQYLAEAGYANNGMIGCTQPRRVAALSVAKRVAEEVGCRLGAEVGYTIRFDDSTGPETKIKYMTDGILQREILLDPDLKKYSVIILDEAHERTISTDVLFGLLKKTLKSRSDLKLIVTSATLDADKFSEYFNGAPIFSIPGKIHPVEILYSTQPEEDYLTSALDTVLQIHLTEPAGDILVFLTGQEEIDTSCEILHERMKALGPNVPELVILPIYSALPSEVQSKVFEPAPPGKRKAVLATNIAETSLTIDGIVFVVDPGFAKQNVYDPKLGMDSLVVTPISQAQAKQRAGRAGRTQPGKCFRLYTEAAYQSEMLPTPIPEIQRQNLSHTILMLKAMGINDLLHFDFMDSPPTNTLLASLEGLYSLGALDEEGLINRLGRRICDFPLAPELAKALITSAEMGCSEEMLSIVAMLSGAQTVFYRPKEKQQQADQKKAKFHDPHGDHLTLLNVYNAWKQSNFNNAWCFENYIQARQMRRVQDVRKQLIQIMDRHHHRLVSCGRNTVQVRKALCAGFFRNAARKDQEGYKTLVEGTPVYLHPNSALFGKPAEHVIYFTLINTTREYMHCTSAIDPKWLVEAAPTFFKVAAGLSKRKKAERIQPLHNRFAAPDDWRLSSQRKQGRGGGGGTWG